MKPSATIRAQCHQEAQYYYVKTSDWKVSYTSGMEIHVLLGKEAQDKQIVGPVPP